MYDSLEDYLYVCRPYTHMRGPGEVVGLIYAGEGRVLVDLETSGGWQALGLVGLETLERAVAAFREVADQEGGTP